MATEKLPGLNMVLHHAELVSQGKKALFIKAEALKRYVGQEVFVIANGKAFAKITFADPVKIDLKKFKSLRNRHKVTEDERKKWWPKKRTFYSYKIRLLEGFSPPLVAKYPAGSQVFVKEVTVSIPEKEVEKGVDPVDSFEESIVMRRSGLAESPLPMGAKRLDDFIPDLHPQEIENVITGETDGESRPRPHRDRPPRSEPPPPPAKAKGLHAKVIKRREALRRSNRVRVQEPTMVKKIKKDNPADGLLSKFKKLLDG